MKTVVALVLVAILVQVVQGKIFTKCELRTELKKYEMTDGTVNKVVCGVEKKGSMGDSSYTNDGEYGIFSLGNRTCANTDQCKDINDCSSFVDDDITDDVKCLKQILTSFLASTFAASHSVKNQILRVLDPNCGPDYFSDCA